MRQPISRVQKIGIYIAAAVIIAALPFIISAADIESVTDETDGLSQGQRNIVLRARQVYEFEWTPLFDIQQDWGEFGYFRAGETYRGIPYGKPNDQNNYVPIGVSFEGFMDALSDPDSFMYTKKATREKIGPYYSCDCSAFVSWAWGLEKVHKSWDLPHISQNLGTDIKQIETGDGFICVGKHAMLIYHVERDDDGKLTKVGIMEMNHPIIRLTWYGEDEEYPISRIYSKYINDQFDEEGNYIGFSIYRYRNRDDVEYVHDCLVPIDNDFCVECFDTGRVWQMTLADALKTPGVKVNPRINTATNKR